LPSMMSCFGVQAWGFQIGVRVLLSMMGHFGCERVITFKCMYVCINKKVFVMRG
jgi:hypothetical protein